MPHCKDHWTPLLHRLHWLKAREQNDFMITFLVYKCQHGAAPLYLANELSQLADWGSTLSMFHLITVADCLPYAVVNSRATEPFWSPQLVVRTVCCCMSRLSSVATWRHVCFVAAFLDATRHSYCCVWGVTPSLSDTLIVFVTCFLIRALYKDIYKTLTCVVAFVRLFLFYRINDDDDDDDGGDETGD